ncbi:MAG: hypothetical protein AAGJ18_29325, partial [Bacteroidota bacterium]
SFFFFFFFLITVGSVDFSAVSPPQLTNMAVDSSKKRNILLIVWNVYLIIFCTLDLIRNGTNSCPVFVFLTAYKSSNKMATTVGLVH